jgi:hypothetical protein
MIMTEKEFLTNFIDHLVSCYFPVTNNEYMENQIDNYLSKVHKEYYEVEFVRIDETMYEQLIREGFKKEDIDYSMKCADIRHKENKQ